MNESTERALLTESRQNIKREITILDNYRTLYSASDLNKLVLRMSVLAKECATTDNYEYCQLIEKSCVLVRSLYLYHKKIRLPDRDISEEKLDIPDANCNTDDMDDTAKSLAKIKEATDSGPFKDPVYNKKLRDLKYITNSVKMCSDQLVTIAPDMSECCYGLYMALVSYIQLVENEDLI